MMDPSNNTLDINPDIIGKVKYDIPHIIKYMGSKKPILDFITSNIENINQDEGQVCDLFAGSCSISAALRRRFDFVSNDIQDYSRVLALTYFADFSMHSAQDILEDIEQEAGIHMRWFRKQFSHLFIDYSLIHDLTSYQETETVQRELLNHTFTGTDYYLFTKYYSGTYWSFEQCAWIDSIRKAAETYKNSPLYYAILSSLMYAMSYTTQSTGHFAQYRDGNSVDAMNNILLYKQKGLLEVFRKKFTELINTLNNSLKKITATTADYVNCLKNIKEGITVYADPPYAPVHYSRFYHALETLVKYDYPKIEFKGRYRTDRHQSPFSQKGNAIEAFKDLFDGIVSKKAQMLLSYSNTGVLEIEQIFSIAQKHFSSQKYTLDYHQFDHTHSTMGRFEDSKRDVVEHLIIAKYK